MSKKKVFYVSVAIAAFFIVGFFLDARSEWFEFATRWARQSSEVHQAIGDVTDVSVFPSSSSYRYNGTEGFAQCAFTVSRTRGEAKMRVELQKTLGKWHVVGATLNGAELSKFGVNCQIVLPSLAACGPKC